MSSEKLFHFLETRHVKTGWNNLVYSFISTSGNICNIFDILAASFLLHKSSQMPASYNTSTI